MDLSKEQMPPKQLELFCLGCFFLDMLTKQNLSYLKTLQVENNYKAYQGDSREIKLRELLLQLF